MEKKSRLRFYGTILSCMLFMYATAQTTTFLSDGADDFVRRQQLLGKVNLSAGLMNRSFASGYAAVDSLLKSWQKAAPIKTGSALKIELLPLTVMQQYNSHHPFGGNDAGMIPARGAQTMVSAGVYASLGRWSLQIKPEYVYAQNKTFETFPTEHFDPYWNQYYRWLNAIDAPEKFGDKPFEKFFPGQSSARYNAGPVSIGLSTENLWWGPGMRNALLMTNNAPGFLHGTINTTKPIHTGIGSFEGQIIAGRLTSSDILPPERNRYDGNGNRLYIPRKEASRYLTGMLLSWQPKWVKGLFVGFTKASYLYRAHMSAADLFPLEGIIATRAEKNNQKASLGSLFARYVMPEEKAELYIEFGRNDRSPNLINLAADQAYPRGYVAGFRKLFALKQDASIELMGEFTQLQLQTAELVRSGRSWYTDTFVSQGYTHQGQVLGSALGPGSNSGILDISWVKGFNKVGLRFERVAQNNDFFYNAFVITQDYTRHWIDVSTTLHADLQFQKFILSSQMAVIRSINYQWYIFPGLGYFKNGYDVLNFHARVSLSYRL